MNEAIGPRLGLETDVDRPEQLVTFLPFLVLFTDGLVERRDEPIDVGLARLGDVLRATTELPDPATPDSLCTVLLEQSLPPAGRNDDTAVLCAYLA